MLLLLDALSEEFPATGAGDVHESKCISIAIPKFPLQASNIDSALSLDAPVTPTNSSIRGDHFSAILEIGSAGTRPKRVLWGW